jgi:hypothetical protein
MPASAGKSRDNFGIMSSRDSGAMFYTKPQNSTEYQGIYFSSPPHVIKYPKDINPHKKKPIPEHIPFTMLKKKMEKNQIS